MFLLIIQIKGKVTNIFDDKRGFNVFRDLEWFWKQRSGVTDKHEEPEPKINTSPIFENQR